jgi:hypothetical protein
VAEGTPVATASGSVLVDPRHDALLGTNTHDLQRSADGVRKMYWLACVLINMEENFY